MHIFMSKPPNDSVNLESSHFILLERQVFFFFKHSHVFLIKVEFTSMSLHPTFLIITVLQVNASHRQM